MRTILNRDELESLEISTMEQLVGHLLSEDSTTVMPGELQALSTINHVPLPELVKQAKEYGLSVVNRNGVK
jgi:hypothetical protein